MADELIKLQQWYAAQCEAVCMVSIMGPDGARHFLSFINGHFFEESEEDRDRTPWQHRYGLSISTIDNPGWCVAIDLAETSLAEAKMSAVEVDKGEHDWVTCKIEDNRFSGVGDPSKLTIILDYFLQLVDNNQKTERPAKFEQSQIQEATTLEGPDGKVHRLIFREGKFLEVGEG